MLTNRYLRLIKLISKTKNKKHLHRGEFIPGQGKLHPTSLLSNSSNVTKSVFKI